ncbi:MAG TPA: C10 family peptidase, partial [Bacteroidia bacterium]|nr:C10 family peptidase [Bacteroidia bacterium]
NVDFWMQKRKTEIIASVSSKLKATPDITDEWTSYAANKLPQSVKNNKKKSTISALPVYKLSHSGFLPLPITAHAKTERGTRQAAGVTFPSSSLFLVSSTWNQSSPYTSSATTAPYIYNSLCPGHSVTGCVATTMAQIMRYWQYPAKGTGTSSYCDCTASGDKNQYGTLSANYATTNYHWSNNMPYNPAKACDIDTLMYDAGVSVAMDYDPSGSAAFVISSDVAAGAPCAQKSYPTYFGYTINILHGMYATSYSATAWQDTLETELNKGRVIQYAGQASDGGHTWVCDGYNASNQFHMNWGWAGGDDGWYALTALTPTGSLGTQPTFNTGLEALIGIIPPASNPPCFGSGTCDTATNLPAKAYLTYYSAVKNEFCTGTYGDTIQQVADYFANPPCSGFTIGSVYIYFYKTSSTTAGRTVNVNIWDNTGVGGAPGAIIATKSVLISSISKTGATLVTFTSPAKVTTPYYVGVDFTTLAAAYKTDTLLVVTDSTNEGEATAWQYDVATRYGVNGWTPANNFWSGFNVSHAIWANLCSPLDVNGVDLQENVKLYPNPTNGIVTAEISLGDASNMQVEVYNTLGQLVQQAQWNTMLNSTHTINLSGQTSGMYFVKFITDKSTITKKIMLNR